MSHPETAAPLISDEYRRMQAELHKNPQYGIASVEYAPLVAQVLDAVGARELLETMVRAKADLAKPCANMPACR